MHIEAKQVKLSDLKLNPDNPRRIGNKEMERLVKSLQEFPDMLSIREIVVDETMTVLGGNMRLLALKKSGVKECTAKIVSGLSPAQKREFIIKDNSAFGEWDMDLLSSSWGDLPLVEWGVDLPEDWLSSQATGEPADAEPQIDKAAELNKIWKVAPGDLWQIGSHRLLCGDSTKAEDVGRVMGGERVDMVFTDPPYGVKIVNCSTKKVGGGGPTHFGKVGGEKIVDARTYPEIAGDNNTDAARLFYEACLSSGIKDFIIFGGNYFTDFLKPSPCWLVWDKENTGNFADCELAWTSFPKAAKLYKWLWNGMSRKGEHAIEGKTRVHPTQKPVGLALNIMNDFPADIYLDGFLGSGSFMVAAQNAGKRMFGIELPPTKENPETYCAVILQRMTDAFPNIEIKRLP
jgi:DNA modification methylase